MKNYQGFLWRRQNVQKQRIKQRSSRSSRLRSWISRIFRTLWFKRSLECFFHSFSVDQLIKLSFQTYFSCPVLFARLSVFHPELWFQYFRLLVWMQQQGIMGFVATCYRSARSGSWIQTSRRVFGVLLLSAADGLMSRQLIKSNGVLTSEKTRVLRRRTFRLNVRGGIYSVVSFCL